MARDIYDRTHPFVEPTEAQYLVLNDLDTLGLLLDSRYDEDTGLWYIYSLSPTLPFAVLQQDGEVTPIELESEL